MCVDIVCRYYRYCCAARERLPTCARVQGGTVQTLPSPAPGLVLTSHIALPRYYRYHEDISDIIIDIET